jgi:parallel beta-helix repeat protein
MKHVFLILILFYTSSYSQTSTHGGIGEPAKRSSQKETSSKHIKDGIIKVNVKSFSVTTDAKTNNAPAIQAAIDFVWNKGGGIVEFSAGTYRIFSKVILRSGVILRGTNKATILWTGGEGAAVEGSGISNFGVDRLSFRGSGTDNRFGAYLLSITDSSHDGYVSNCTFSNSYIGVFIGNVSTISSYSIKVYKNAFYSIGLNGLGVNCFGHGFIIDNNVFHNCGIVATANNVGSAIEFRGSSRSRITNNTMSDLNYGGVGTCDGIRLEFAVERYKAQVKDVAVENNVIKNFSGHGIRIMYTKRCSILRNTIECSATSANGILLCSDDLQAQTSDSNTISSNKISGSIRFAGIAAEGTIHQPIKLNVIEKNIIQKCYTGIAVHYANNNLFSNNTVKSCTGQAIVQYSGNSNPYIKNTATNSFAGAAFLNGSAAQVRENSLSENKQGLFVHSDFQPSHFEKNYIKNNNKNIINNCRTCIVNQ